MFYRDIANSFTEFHVLKLSCDGFTSFIQVQQLIDYGRSD